jgi:hypothetical protein
MVPRVSPLRPWLLKMVALIAPLTVGASMGCTLVLDASPAQCQRTDDCARFAGTICDTVRHLCAAAAADDGGPGGDGAGDDPADPAETTGCAAGTNAPSPGFELLNACTDATCLPFDNRQRLRNLPGDGVLPPLPELPAGRP